MPHLPTEIWDKIFDIKYYLEDKEAFIKHNDYHEPVLDQLTHYFTMFDAMHGENKNLTIKSSHKLSTRILIDDRYRKRYESCNTKIVPYEWINGYSIDISTFNKFLYMIISIENESLYDPTLDITDDESDDNYLSD
jgi:hypothetical protein